MGREREKEREVEGEGEGGRERAERREKGGREGCGGQVST